MTEILKMLTPHAPTLVVVLYFGYRIVQELSRIRERLTKVEQKLDDHLEYGSGRDLPHAPFA